LAAAPEWTEEQAAAALRVVRAGAELEAYLDAEAGLSDAEAEAREDAWARASARDAVREEPW
jgi:hypothetical protein